MTLDTEELELAKKLNYNPEALNVVKEFTDSKLFKQLVNYEANWKKLNNRFLDKRPEENPFFAALAAASAGLANDFVKFQELFAGIRYVTDHPSIRNHPELLRGYQIHDLLTPYWPKIKQDFNKDPMLWGQEDRLYSDLLSELAKKSDDDIKTFLHEKFDGDELDDKYKPFYTIGFYVPLFKRYCLPEDIKSGLSETVPDPWKLHKVFVHDVYDLDQILRKLNSQLKPLGYRAYDFDLVVERSRFKSIENVKKTLETLDPPQQGVFLFQTTDDGVYWLQTILGTAVLCKDVTEIQELKQ